MCWLTVLLLKAASWLWPKRFSCVSCLGKAATMKTLFCFLRLVQDDYFTSVHIEDFKIDVRDTKLGPEVVTRDIPNVGEEKLKI
jgi:hypothetical protein